MKRDKLSARVQQVRGNSLSLGVLLLCGLLSIWWIVIVVDPGWQMWMRIPGEVCLPPVTAALVHFAFFVAREDF